MKEFGMLLRTQRKRLKLTMEEMGKKCGYSKSYIGHLEAGNRKPKPDTLKVLADAYKIPYQQLMDVIGYVDDIPKNAITGGKTTYIPVYGKIAAGVAIKMQDVIEYRQVLLIDEKITDGEYFYLQVQGDSMIGSRIHSGDLVLVKKQQEVENGEIAVVSVNGDDATLKRVKQEGNTYVLYADNPAYEPIIINNERAQIFGKVVKVEFSV